MTPDIGQHKIKARKVFYIPGFDPMPPRRYRELYRREGAKQAAICGYTLTQEKHPDGPASSWRVNGHFDGFDVQSDFEVLVWSDIVKSSMKPSFFNIYIKSFYDFANYISTGALYNILKVRVGPAIVALYPPIVTLVQLIFGIFFVTIAFQMTQSLSLGLASFVAIILGTFWFYCMRILDKYLYAHYLMLDYSYFARDKGLMPNGLKGRLEEFVQKVIRTSEQSYEEILIVGHSSGAQLAINLAANVLRQAKDTKLGILTLGHSIPMASFLPKAQYIRQDLRFLSENQDATWLDVSAPGDGACFALADPVAISGVATEKQINPKVLSAAFSRTLSQEQNEALRFRFFKKHFQYLCAFAHPDNYDYFKITSGPQSFAEYAAAISESPSKITKSYSGFVDV